MHSINAVPLHCFQNRRYHKINYISPNAFVSLGSVRRILSHTGSETAAHLLFVSIAPSIIFRWKVARTHARTHGWRKLRWQHEVKKISRTCFDSWHLKCMRSPISKWDQPRRSRNIELYHIFHWNRANFISIYNTSLPAEHPKYPAFIRSKT